MFTVLCSFRCIICLIIMKTDNESKRTKIDYSKKEKHNRRSLNFFFFTFIYSFNTCSHMFVNNVKCDMFC